MKKLCIFLTLIFSCVIYTNAQVKFVSVTTQYKSNSETYALQVTPNNNGHTLNIGLNNNNFLTINDIGIGSFNYIVFEKTIISSLKSSTKTIFKDSSDLIFEPPLSEWYNYIINKITIQPLTNSLDSLKAIISEPAGILVLKKEFERNNQTFKSEYATVEIDDDLMRISYHYKVNDTAKNIYTARYLIPLKRSDDWNLFKFYTNRPFKESSYQYIDKNTDSINGSNNKPTNVKSENGNQHPSKKNKTQVQTPYILLSDFLDYIPDSISRNKTYNVEYYNSSLYPNKYNMVLLKQKNLYDYFNLTGFIQMYDILNAGAASNNNINAQIELNINAPILKTSNAKGFRFLGGLNLNANLSPLGKYTPYFAFPNRTLDSQYVKNVKYEIFRNHFTNTSFRINTVEKNWGQFVFSSLSVGMHYYTSKIRENDLIKKSSIDTTESFTDFSKADIVHFIGPELGTVFKHKVSRIFGYDMRLDYQYLWMQNNRYDLLETKRVELMNQGLGNINSKENRNLNLISFEANFYFRPFINQASNRSGFNIRTRLFDDLNSSLPPVFQFMIGYSLNLEDVVKF